VVYCEDPELAELLEEHMDVRCCVVPSQPLAPSPLPGLPPAEPRAPSPFEPLPSLAAPHFAMQAVALPGLHWRAPSPRVERPSPALSLGSSQDTPRKPPASTTVPGLALTRPQAKEIADVFVAARANQVAFCETLHGVTVEFKPLSADQAAKRRRPGVCTLRVGKRGASVNDSVPKLKEFLRAHMAE
jgi:hypothetical protein